MKKLLGYKFFVAALLAAGFASCDNYNEDEDDTFNTRADKPVVTVSATDFTVTEGEDVTITLTADKALTVPMEFKLELLPSSTGGFRDFVASGEETSITTGAGIIGYLVTMPAYTTSYTFTISPELDLEAEGTEVFNFRLYSASNSTGLIAEGNENITVTVNNGTSNDFIASVRWGGDYADDFGTLHAGTYLGVDGNEHEYCDFDFDMEVYDASFNIFEVDYDNCPATVVIPADAPDGDYIIVPSFWDRATAAGSVPQSGNIIYPVFVDMGKPGVFSHTVDLTGTFTYVAGGANNGNPDAYVPVAIVTKVGTTYTLKDYNDPSIILGQGRAAFMNMLLNKKAKI